MARPILYSFRRCPYAMRARLAIAKSDIKCEMREVDLKAKPQAMLDVSPKGTVPVVLLPEGRVLEESVDVMRWSLAQNDPDGWLDHPESDVNKLIQINDQDFTKAINIYKYPQRFEGVDAMRGRETGVEFLKQLELNIAAKGFVLGSRPSMADAALVPFVRQFAKVDWNWFEDCGLRRVKIWLHYFTDSPLFEVVMERYSPWQSGDPVDVFPVFKDKIRCD